MSRGLNKVMIIERIATAPKMHLTPNTVSVANFSVACDRVWKSVDGQRLMKFKVVAWSNLAGQ